MMHRTRSVILLLAMIAVGTACGGGQVEWTATPSPTPQPPTATSLPTASPTNTPEPPTPTATFSPVDGVVSWDVNVHTGPSVNFPVLYFIARFEHVQIVGRDVMGEWYQIIYKPAEEGVGWVRASLIEIEDARGIPIIGLDISSENPPLTARVTQRLNVRGGPSFDYAVYGMIDPPTVVVLTGKNRLGTWLQIVFADGIDGRGWINVGYVMITESDTSSLPVLNDDGTPYIAVTGSPTPMPEIPTPTIGPAILDGDSPSSPGIQVVFSPLGTRSLQYSSDLSWPEGDGEDWVQFTPYSSLAGQSARISVSLSCIGNGSLAVELQQSEVQLTDWGTLTCGEDHLQIWLAEGKPAQFHLLPSGSAGTYYIKYILKISNEP